ncbi:MFS transporter [Streptomyces sp. NBC_00096]|uniref:MFS transporter n=1 Tax=Streptomyces sp. NBC_00096 TaxID=2975650 RepID=UPI0032553621
MTISGQSRAGKARTDGEDAFGWRFTTPLYLGTALNPINSSIIATALVPIATDLHVPVGSTAVLVSCLYLASAIAQPTAGKLAEEFGPRRVFLAGVLLVLAGGLIGGFGQSLGMLTVARVLIGIGTSAGYPAAMVSISRRAGAAGMSGPPGGVLGGISLAGMSIAAVGPPLGGLLVGALGWHWAFLINIPVTAVTLLTALLHVPRDPAPVERRDLRTVAARLDFVGIALFGGTMAALINGLPHLDRPVLAVAAALAAVLAWWELRHPTPFVDLRALRENGALTRTYLRVALTALGAYTVMYGLVQWMQDGRGMSAGQAGLMLLPMGVLSALLARPLAKRNLVRGPLRTAGLALLAGSITIVLLGNHSPVLAILAVTLIYGVVMGTTSVANQTALYLQAPPDQIGTAAGLMRTFTYLGPIASATITGAVFKHGATDRGLHTIGLVLIAAAAAVLALTALDRTLETPAATLTEGPAEIPHRPAATADMENTP